MPTKETVQIKYEDWVAQVVAQRPDVEGRTITVRPDPEDPDSKIILFKMKALGWSADNRDSTIIDVSLVHSIHKKYGHEGITLAVRLPQNLQHKDLPSFTDEATEGWHKYVARDLRQDPRYAWRVFPKVSDNDQEQLILTYDNPITGDEDDQVYLYIDDIWDLPFNPGEFGVKTREEYVNLLLDALSRSYRVVIKYLETFNRQEIPRLLQKREERVKNKPAGWLAQTMLQRRDIDKKNFERQWLVPEEGVEPDTVVVAGIIKAEGPGPCLFVFSGRDLGGRYPSHYLNFFLFAPQELQQVLKAKADQLAAYLERQKAAEKPIIFKTGKVVKYFNLVKVPDEGGKGSAMAFRVEYWGTDVRALKEAGISSQAIVNKTIDTFLGLLPHLKGFKEAQSK